MLYLLAIDNPEKYTKSLKIGLRNHFAQDRVQKRALVNIVMCRSVRLTKIAGSSSDDWIYWHFGYNLSLITINTALSLIYTPLHKHYDPQSSPVVS
jgi:hypothetical protein